MSIIIFSQFHHSQPEVGAALCVAAGRLRLQRARIQTCYERTEKQQQQVGDGDLSSNAHTHARAFKHTLMHTMPKGPHACTQTTIT